VPAIPISPSCPVTGFLLWALNARLIIKVKNTVVVITAGRTMARESFMNGPED
jgi:hypothetical protein